MLKVLFLTVPFVGHVTPLLPVAAQLVRSGHQVLWMTGRKFRPAIEATGARFEPMAYAKDYDDKDVAEAFPALRGLTGLPLLKAALMHVFLAEAQAQLADLERVLKDFAADVLASDQCVWGSLFLIEKRGLPGVCFSVIPYPCSSPDSAPFGLGLGPVPGGLGRVRDGALTLLFREVLFRDVNRYYDGIRARVGLPPAAGGILAFPSQLALWIQFTTPSFEYPREEFAEKVRFVGPIRPPPAAGAPLPAWWDELSAGRPVVHVTQGTFATDHANLLVPTLEALAGLDVLVVGSTGGKPVAALPLKKLPRNARVAAFLPYAQFLPHVSVYVTNGGYGGVNLALAHGIPIVVAGTTEDKREVSRRVEWAGVGVSLRTDRPTRRRLRQAVEAVLGDPRYRLRAEEIAAEMRTYDGPVLAARYLEEVVAAHGARDKGDAGRA